MVERREAREPFSSRSDGIVAIPGIVCVTETTPTGGRVVHGGDAAGWLKPAGILSWSHEVSVVARKDISDALCRDLRLLLPENRVLAIQFPRVHKAAKVAPLLAVSSDDAKSLMERGIRVFTVGFDRISGGFFFFAQGGEKGTTSLQADLYQAIVPSLEAGDSRTDIDAWLDGIVDRLLVEKSDGILSDMAVERAAALPRGAGAGQPVRALDDLEASMKEIEQASVPFEKAAKEMISLLERSERNDETRVSIPLFGEAIREEQPVLVLQMMEGEGGKTTFVQLSARFRWLVKGPIGEPAVAPTPAEEGQKEEAERKKAEEPKRSEKQAKSKKTEEPKRLKEDETKPSPVPPVSENNKSMAFGVAVVAIVIVLVALMAWYFRN